MLLTTKTFTYSGGNLNVGSHTLSIGGAGTFSNATGSPLDLDVAGYYPEFATHNGPGIQDQ